jgi:cysteine dioxygenase
MQKINTLIQNINKLSLPLNIKEAITLLENDIASEELIQNAKYSDTHYTRNVIYKNDNLEAIIISWKTGQSSLIHNHKNSACIVKVLQGIATELVFNYGEDGLLYPSQVNNFKKDSVSYSYDEDVHQIINTNKEDLITLHLYSPALKDMEAFSLEDTCFRKYADLYYKMSDINSVTTLNQEIKTL